MMNQNFADQPAILQRLKAMIMSVVMVAIAVLVVGCGNSSSLPPEPAYTPDEISQIQEYKADIAELRDRFSEEIPSMIDAGDWRDVETFIHGPMGELRTKMANLGRNLTPDLQVQARDQAREVFKHFVGLDEAARDRNPQKAIANYSEAVDDLNIFIDLVPESVLETETLPS
jgi:photosystem II protein PsbQ